MSFSEYVKSKDGEGKEKHLPVIEVQGENVCVTVGKEVAHPNTIEHHIKWIRLYGVKKGSKVPVDIAYLDLGPTLAHPALCVKLASGDFEKLFAVAYCNIHGVWENCIVL